MLRADRFKSGFTLIELMLALAVFAILVVIALPSYQYYIRKTRLNQAQNALLLNAQEVERFYSQNLSFKSNSTTWMPLVQTETDHFCIRFQGNPRGTNNQHQYTIKAVAFDTNREPRIIKINQDHTVMLCASSSSSCTESTPFFSGGSSVDRQCTVIGS
ncbi:prepilin-type N-terminal cleavage/methylation domain-containing protein [Neisseria sp. HSC-16F19]|nr:type IV pilin protein [Neisseria sp. HSC-16F19]MCP2040498.1 prepilin-type N-terminal cleavage/methylation domain-containing protein [Neisseria sp. HSC-16F19]